MGISAKERQRSYEANHPECRGCETRVYWRDGDYCPTCVGMPERHCFACERMSHTDGSVCLHCEAPYGRLAFGFDRLSATPPYGRTSQNERIGGWTDKTPHPDAVWHEAAPTAWRNGEMVATPAPVFKAKAPGIGWPKLDKVDGRGAPPTAWMRKAQAEVNWYSCGVCGVSFGPGDGGKTRQMVEGTLDWRYTFSGPRAHASCPQTQSETDAMAAAHLAERLASAARNADRLAGREYKVRSWDLPALSWSDPEQAPAVAQVAA